MAKEISRTQDSRNQDRVTPCQYVRGPNAESKSGSIVVSPSNQGPLLPKELKTQENSRELKETQDSCTSYNLSTPCKPTDPRSELKIAEQTANQRVDP